MSKKELERRQREEQEATGRAFQEFIKTFQDVSGPPNKTFVKSGILNVKTGQEIQSEKGQIYNPQPIIKSSSSTIKNAIECATLLKDTKIERIKGQEKPKTNLEILKEELKLRHLERGQRTKLKDDLELYSSLNLVENHNPITTNLFIAHMSVKTTENDLMQLFGAYGPLASVKIMWPRIDERNRATNCGFVAFMSRKDAERAMYHLKNFNDMTIAWGKPIEIPSHPIYIPPELLKVLHHPVNTGLPFNAQPTQQQFKYPSTQDEMQDLLFNSIINVTIPLDKRILMIIHRTIEFVIQEGPLFEAIIMNKEINNPLYQFLFDNTKSEHIYYRWKLYSLMHGDTHKKWSTEAFRMFKNGSVWCPPVVYDYTSGMPKNLITGFSKLNNNMLSDAQASRLIQLIRTLNMSKNKIGEAMIFCLNHVDAVQDVVDLIVDSFMNKSTKAPQKVARLYLLSDVLYNSSMKKCLAPIYRTEVEKHLPTIFNQLQITLNQLTLSADIEAFKSRVLNVLKSWDLWKIYPSTCLDNLQKIFSNIDDTEIELDGDEDYNEPLDGDNLIKRSVKVGAECIITKKTDNIQTDIMPGFIPSKWELVDPNQVEEQAMSTKKFYDMEIERQMKEKHHSESVPSQSNEELSDEKRDILRKVELMVMHYQDDFESGKRTLKKGVSLDQELASFREHLLQRIKKDGSKKSSSSESCSDDNKENDKKLTRSKKRRNKARYEDQIRKRLHK